MPTKAPAEPAPSNMIYRKWINEATCGEGIVGKGLGKGGAFRNARPSSEALMKRIAMMDPF